jgi:hypothetical protein
MVEKAAMASEPREIGFNQRLPQSALDAGSFLRFGLLAQELEPGVAQHLFVGQLVGDRVGLVGLENSASS